MMKLFYKKKSDYDKKLTELNIFIGSINSQIQQHSTNLDNLEKENDR